MNEIAKQQIPITEIMSIGKAFVESGMFPDVKTAAQAIVKIQAGQEIGITPFAAMTGIHIILGRPTLGAGVIASKVKGSGKYDYRVVDHTDRVCWIDFYQGKEIIGTSKFTIEDAKKAGTKNLDKFPMNMLFARCISNGVKWFCPDVFSGPVYTPEEMESVQDSGGTIQINSDTAFDNVPTQGELQDLRQLVYTSTLDEDGQYNAFESIDKCTDYKMYEKVKLRLEDLQQTIDDQQNPSQKTISHHLKKLA